MSSLLVSPVKCGYPNSVSVRVSCNQSSYLTAAAILLLGVLINSGQIGRKDIIWNAKNSTLGERTMKIMRSILAVTLTLSLSTLVQAKEPFSAMDVFKISYAGDPVVSPNGQAIVFSRYSMDVMLSLIHI